ncbi:MAG TPA: hypothetical protein DEO54_08255 [Rikenellaceae bacterium]|nr:hypothetical protein [Rikenellaceae bacterium]HBZ26213.1 hypothetical protein [Rikenellaceae bacterium]
MRYTHKSICRCKNLLLFQNSVQAESLRCLLLKQSVHS